MHRDQFESLKHIRRSHLCWRPEGPLVRLGSGSKPVVLSSSVACLGCRMATADEYLVNFHWRIVRDLVDVNKTDDC